MKSLAWHALQGGLIKESMGEPQPVSSHGEELHRMDIVEGGVDKEQVPTGEQCLRTNMDKRLLGAIRETSRRACPADFAREFFLVWLQHRTHGFRTTLTAVGKMNSDFLLTLARKQGIVLERDRGHNTERRVVLEKPGDDLLNGTIRTNSVASKAFGHLETRRQLVDQNGVCHSICPGHAHSLHSR